MNLWDERFDFRCFETIPIDFCEGSKVLTRLPFALLLANAWSPLLTSLTSILATFMSHLPQRKCILSSHAPSLFILFNMASSGIFPYLHAPFVNVMLPSRSVYSPENTLLAVISGVDEGIVQGIPW